MWKFGPFTHNGGGQGCLPPAFLLPKLEGAEVSAVCDAAVPGAGARLEVSKASISYDVLIKTADGDSYALHLPRNKAEHDKSP